MKINYSNKDYFRFAGHTLLGVDFFLWLRLLIRHRKSIDWKYIPKICFMSVPILFNYPIQRLERVIYDRRIKHTKIHKPVFILGHYRSGTTLLHEIMCTDEQFAFCNTNQALNPLTFRTTGKLTRALIKAFLPLSRPMDNMTLGADSPMEEEFALACITDASLVHGFYFPRDLNSILNHSALLLKPYGNWQSALHYMSKKIACVNPGKTLLFKSPGNTARIKELLDLFPDARFIHIHRHPYDVFRSTMHLYEKLLPLHGFCRIDNKELEAYVLTSYEKIYRKYFDEMKQVPRGQLIEISYRDFVNSAQDQLNNIYNQLNLGAFDDVYPMFEKELSRRAGYDTNQYDALTDETQKKIKKAWKAVFNQYSYT